MQSSVPHIKADQTLQLLVSKFGPSRVVRNQSDGGSLLIKYRDPCRAQTPHRHHPRCLMECAFSHLCNIRFRVTTISGNHATEAVGRVLFFRHSGHTCIAIRLVNKEGMAAPVAKYARALCARSLRASCYLASFHNWRRNLL